MTPTPEALQAAERACLTVGKTNYDTKDYHAGLLIGANQYRNLVVPCVAAEFQVWMDRVKELESWTRAEDAMPTRAGPVIVAQFHEGSQSWLYYTGGESEESKAPWRPMWFVDDDYLIELEGTFWKPIGLPPDRAALSDKEPQP